MLVEFGVSTVAVGCGVCVGDEVVMVMVMVMVVLLVLMMMMMRRGHRLCGFVPALVMGFVFARMVRVLIPCPCYRFPVLRPSPSPSSASSFPGFRVCPPTRFMMGRSVPALRGVDVCVVVMRAGGRAGGVSSSVVPRVCLLLRCGL